MKKENNKVDFDLSELSLEQLVKVYNDIVDFLQFLNDNKFDIEEKGSGKDE